MRERGELSQGAVDNLMLTVKASRIQCKRYSGCHRFTTTALRAVRPEVNTRDRDWITNIRVAFPERPVGYEDPQPSRAHRPPNRFPVHADLLQDAKFPALHGFSVPPPGPSYMAAWLEHLLTGPFLPLPLRTAPESPKTSPIVDFSARPEKLLFFLERAWGHKQDVITELVASGKWQHAVWIVRVLLEPSFEYPSPTTQGLLDDTKYSYLGDTHKYNSSLPREGDIPPPGIAGRSGLWNVKDLDVKLDIERRRRGFGVILGSLAGMILRAGEELPNGGNRLGDNHTDLLPTVRQILAYCHTTSLMPDQLYAVYRYPRLHMLRSRILASLADAVWRAQEAMVAAEAAAFGIVGEYRGMEVPKARHRFSVWGSGTQDIPDSTVARSNPSQIPYAEREVWMELVLTVIVEAGYGNIGASTIKSIHNTWNFTDYTARHPYEYTPENIARLNREPKSGIAGRWSLEGHSLLPALVTTLPLTLPDWIPPAVADAVVDSTAEGRGIESMFSSILSYARALPMRKETMRRLLRHPALTSSQSAEVLETGAALLWQFGNRGKAIDMYYAALSRYIAADNLAGSMRVWNDSIMPTRFHHEPPRRITGMYLALLVRRRCLGRAWDLLRFTRAPAVIPQSAYSAPALAPAILALAIQTQSKKLYELTTAAVTAAARSGETWITPATYTSILNAQLEFGDTKAARQTLLDMKANGVEADGVAIAVLVRHELKSEPEAGYALVERESGLEFAGSVEDDGTQEKHGATLSRDGWAVVIDYAVAGGDDARVAWALKGAGIDLKTGAGLDTVVFNILLRGVAEREGAWRAMKMCHQHHTRGDRGDGRVVGNAISFRTVLHSAVRELIAIDRRTKVQWEVRKVELKLAMETKQPRKKGKREREESDLQSVIKWCWDEMRGSGMQLDDVISAVRTRLWKRMEPDENWRKGRKERLRKLECARTPSGSE